MKHRALLLIGVLCFAYFAVVDIALAEGTRCAVRNLRSIEAINKSQRCVMAELEQASHASDDLKAALNNILGTFALAKKYAAESDKYLLIYNKTQDPRADAKHQDYEKLYQQAFSTFETYRNHLDEIGRTRNEFAKLIPELKERINILNEYEVMLRKSNEIPH